MREILFRGKTIRGTHRDRETGEWLGVGTWVEGFFVNCSSVYDDREKDRVPEIVEYMADRQYTGEYCYMEVHEVDPDTVSQYTGVKDKNGRMIFEGDIVRCSNLWLGYEIRTIIFDEEYLEFEFNPDDPVRNPEGLSLCADHMCCEVIGNIWDNPELLEVK